MGFVRDLINREFEELVEKAKISNNLEYEEIKIKMKDCHDALLILNSSSLQFNGKYKTDFDNWIKDQSIEIDEEGIWIDETKLVDGDTLLDFYECKTKSV